MTPSRFEFLLTRYRLQSLSADEQEELLAFAQDGDEQLWQELLQTMMTEENNLPLEQEFISRELAAVLSVDKPVIRPVKRIWFRYAAAAMLVLAIGAYLYINNKNEQKLAATTPAKTNIIPGRDGAILTLADGTKVVLDSLGNGVVATQNGTQIVLKNGMLTYNAEDQSTATVAYNTMHTPKGRQFQLLLPDGSKVWLNAASSIKYPTVFNGNERNVEIAGEAYFEVAKNPHQPFKVQINNAVYVEVLGTHFNVNAYSNEDAIKTTLIEGKVKLSSASESAILKPGQQAALTQQAPIAINDKIDVDKVLAWKNGIFNFDGLGLKEVMQQLERWYDIEVVYEKGVPDVHFYGKLDRQVSLPTLLEVLQKSDIHFKIEGRKLIVLP
jgi:transmembrane sensor